MNEWFFVASEPGRRLLRSRLSGLWDIETVAAYQAAVLQAGAELVGAGVERGEINVLIDARDFAAQPQAVIAAYQKAFDSAESDVRRVAVVVSNPIFRLQAKRIGTPGQRVFDTEAQALDWLNDQ